VSSTAAIILAAGKSTRMKSDLPKVVHDVCGKPMLWHVIHACHQAGARRILVVVGHGKDTVIEAITECDPGLLDCVEWIEQTEQLGTAHAVLECESKLSGFDGAVLTIAGDMPLLRSETLTELLMRHNETGDAVTLATCELSDPGGYGRIVHDKSGQLAGIVEDRDCTDAQREINEVNVSYYCFDGRRMFDLLNRIGCDNAKGEYYITDAVKIALEAGEGAGALPAVPAEDAMGINSRHDLAIVSRAMQDRIQANWMQHGVTIVDPASAWIESGCRIGQDSVVYPFSFIGAGASVGAACRIGPGVTIASGSVVPNGVVTGGGVWSGELLTGT